MTSKTVIVTGASRGVGAAIAKVVATFGAKVALFARTESDLEEVKSEIIHSGGEAISIVGDVSREEVCADLISQVVNQFGHIDALVNNAGMIQPIQLISQFDATAWNENWKANFLGPVQLCQLAIPYLREREGRIVNISSGAALRPIPGWGAYSSAKAALDHFTRILSIEETEVVCIGMRPGVVDTAMQIAIIRDGKEGMPAAEYEKFVKQRDDGKLISPALPGRAAAILALHAPKAWSGEILNWNADKVAELVTNFPSQASSTSHM